MINILRKLVITLVWMIFGFVGYSQNNLAISYQDASTVPDFLNVCGDPDDVVVVISLDGVSTDPRENIVATANLFEGIQFVNFDAAASPGVTLLSSANLNMPVFSITPSLSPAGTSSVAISFSIASNCNYVDTLNANNAIQVLDTWDFEYDMGGSSFIESDVNTEYRDALAVPFLTAEVINNYGPARVGDCFSREIVVNNSALNGYLDHVEYSNQQGAGIWVSSVLVNGIPIVVDKILTTGGDTLITANLSGVLFQGNTSGASPGDGDEFLDPDETFIITENICVLDCDLSRQSSYDLSWGCYGSVCDNTELEDFVPIGQGLPNISVNNSGSIPNVNAGYCQSGVSTVTFTNEGVELDPGFATMIDVATTIAFDLGDTLYFQQDAFTITAIYIAGVLIPNPEVLTSLDGNALFASDPDGPGGLTDFDGDGYFDDLPAGESYEITVDFEFDCSMAAEYGVDLDCPNDFSASFDARIYYTDACDDRVVSGQENYYGPSNRLSGFENFTDPDALINEDTFFLNHYESRTVGNFDRSCGGGEVYYAAVILPPGVNVAENSWELVKDNSSTPLPVTGTAITNDTFYIQFDASITYIPGEFYLSMAFTTDCSAQMGPTTFPLEFGYYCPSCDCRHIWYCGHLTGPQLHANSPPCPPLVCDPGVQTIGFEANRTTFGYTDNTYSVPFDPDDANKKVAIQCDSVEMKVLNIVGDQPITDSVGVVITYSNVDETTSTDEIFNFGEATVRITNGGNEFMCNVTAADLTSTVMDSLHLLNFDLNPCIQDIGITLQPGDTIEFVSQFALNPDGPYIAQFRKVPDFRAYAYAMVDGSEYACDNFGEIFTIAKNTSVFAVPNSNNFPTGCDEVYLEYRIVTINNGFADWFGDEYRQATGVDSLIFNYDPNILGAYEVFEPEVSIPGHPFFANGFFPMPAFDNSGTYSVQFDTLNQVPSLNDVSFYTFNFRIRVIPGYNTLTGSSLGDNRYDFDPTIYWTDRYYADDIGDGSCAIDNVETVDNDIYYSDPPTFNYSTVTSSHVFVNNDTAMWTIQYCNTSFSADAGITWVGFENNQDNFEIVEINDITDPANVMSLPISTYGANNSNYFALTSGLLRADGSNSLDQICNTLEVTAKVTDCGRTDIDSRAGWNCTVFSDPNWTPDLYPPTADTLGLSVTVYEPFLDASVIDQSTVDPEICDTMTNSFLLRNADLGNAYDIITQFVLPLEGAVLIPGSVEFAYPPSQPWQSVAIDPTYIGPTAQGQLYQYDDFTPLSSFLDQNGLPGFDPINFVDSNEFKIRYQYISDCDFISGSLSYYNFQGFKVCGDSTNFESGETLPVVINGTQVSGNKLFSTNFSPTSALIPGASSTLEITVENLTAVATDTIDKVKLRLPAGVTYDAATTVAIAPGTWVIEEPSVEMLPGGVQVLKWCLPTGMQLNDQAIFQFDLSSPILDCSITDLAANLTTITQIEVFCGNGNTNCNVESITGSNGDALISVPVMQNLLTFNFDSVTSSCGAADQETVMVNGAITNSNIPFPAVPFTLNYYADSNGNGLIDTGEPIVQSFTENGPIAAFGSLSYNHDINVATNQVCDLIVAIDTTGLSLCDVSATSIGTPPLVNAGADEVLCATEVTPFVVNLGDPNCAALSGYSYNWLAVAPANLNSLSATNIPNPILNIIHNGTTQDSVQYILETTRPICGTSRDTVTIVRALGIDINAGPVIFVLPGGSTTLSPIVSGGCDPMSYNWEPAASLDDPTSAMPLATPTADTDYLVTVTSCTGCTQTATVQVRIGGAVTGVVEPTDTLICASETVQFNASGGTDYLWLPSPSNIGGMLNDVSIPNPVFSGGLPNSTYMFDMVVSDATFPGFTDTVSVTISTYAAPSISIDTDGTTLICGNQETTLTASGAVSYEWFEGGTAIGSMASIVVAPAMNTTYTVVGTDANGCTGSNDITIGINITPIAEASADPPAACAGEIVMLSGGFGSELNWYEDDVFVGSGFTIPVTPDTTTTWTLIVENVLGCTDTTTVTVEVFELPEILTPINAISNCIGNTVPVSITIDEDIDTFLIAGTGAYNNDVVVNNNTLTFDAIYVDENSNFEVFITGTENLCTVVETFEFQECGCIPPGIAGVSTSDSQCFSSIGSATINVTAPLEDLTFTWTPDVGNPIGGAPNSRENLPFGGYTVVVAYADRPDCFEEVSFGIFNVDGPQATAVTTNATCASADGTATLTPTDFAYAWADGFTGSFRDDLETGTYFPTLTDPNDPADPACENIVAVIVGQDNPLVADVVINNQSTCGLSDGSATINVTGGSGMYSYSWPGGTDTFNGLNGGIHIITVTELNGDGCELPVMFVMTDNVPPGDITITDTLDVSCPGLFDGGIVFDVNYDPAFDGQPDTIISNGLIEFENNQLPPGDYCVVIEDGSGCTAGGECFTIEQPEPLNLSFAVQSACGVGGIIDLSITGGTTPYTIDWLDIAGPANTEDRIELVAGDYQVVVTDANNCTTEATVTVTDCGCTPPTLTSTSVNDATCGNSDGSAIINLFQDEANYSFTWDPDLGIDNALGNGRSGLPFGGYTISITPLADPSCDPFEVNILIENEDGPTATVVTTPATCEAADGTATLSPDTFEYIWADSSMLNMRTDLTTGTYFVTFTDPANPDCPNAISVFVDQFNPLVADITVDDQPDCGFANGQVTINVSGGSGNYSYDWGDGDATESNLAAGVYLVNVTDLDSTMCELPVIFVLTDSVPPATVIITDTIDVSCPGFADGSVLYDITYDPDFTHPADTMFTNGSLEYTNGNFTAQDYCLVIRDSNTCVAGGACFSIDSPDPLLIMFETEPACDGMASINVNVEGGTPPFNYDWADLTGTNDPQNRINLPEGTFELTITDANGCEISDMVSTECPCVPATVTSLSLTESLCGQSVGAATIGIANPENYTYTWDPDLGVSNADGNGRSGLEFGGYVVQITNIDDPTCSTEVAFLITNADGPDATYSSTPATCEAADGTATLLPNTFEYLWDDSLVTNLRTDLVADTYFVTFTDPANPECQNAIAVVVDEFNPLIADIVVDDQPDCGFANGQVTIIVTGGSGNYSFDWGDGTATQDSLIAGVYVVNVTDLDSTMCQLPVIFVLTDSVPPATVIITDTIDVSCPGLADGSVLYDITYDPAFTPPADTVFTNGSVEFTNGNFSAQDYCLVITDSSTCVAGGACFSIEAPDPIMILFETELACEGMASINVNVEGGTPPFTYDWGDLPGPINDQNRVNLPSGTFALTITDANGCELSDMVTTECPCEPAAISSTSVTESLCGQSIGAATINLANPENYTYVWMPDEGMSNGNGNGRFNMPYGGYVVQIINLDDPSCMTEVEILVTNADGPEATYMSTPATCEAADGTATMMPDSLDYVWPDLQETFERDDLTSGTYFVTFTDPADPDCPNVINVVVEEFNPLTAEVVILDQPDCGLANGTAMINVSGGSGNYSYSWPSGTDTQDNLFAGVHIVNVTDLDSTMCELPVIFVLTDSVPPAMVTIIDTIDVSCPGFADGGVTYDVQYDLEFNGPADTIISNGFIFENNMLPGGSYCLVIEDSTDCVAGGACFTIEEPDPLTLSFVVRPSCNEDGAVNVNVTGGTEPYSFAWDGIAADTSFIMDLSIGNYMLTVTDGNGCTVAEDSILVDDCMLPEPCNVFLEDGPVELMIEDCLDSAEYCIMVPLQEIAQYDIYDNGDIYTGPLAGCEFTSFPGFNAENLLNIGPGPFIIETWEINDTTYTSGEFTTVEQFVDTLNFWDPGGNWELIDLGSISLITGSDPSNTYGMLVITDQTVGSQNTIEGIDENNIPGGHFMPLDTGYHEIVFYNPDLNCADTVDVFVSCGELENPVIGCIFVNDTVTYCIDTSLLMIEGEIESIANVCPELSGENVEFQIDTDTYCVTYIGLAIGVDTACVELCTDLGNCDTIIFSVKVIPELTQDKFFDTIFINNLTVYCPDTTELPGNVVSIENICPNDPEDFVSFTPDILTHCVNYDGLALGQDSSCIVICDDLGFCDTTIMCVLVEENLTPPLVVDDYDTVTIGNPTVILVKENDNLVGAEIETFEIVVDPLYGSATANPDCTITYIAGDEFCARTDTFTYVVCNMNGCDTATVFVYIECIDIFIFNAMSPNKDGVNDVFFIAGIEDYPENELCIFNRWGNQVYIRQGYKNDWQGTWDGNKDLPDGTYYYVLQLNDDMQRVFRGYLELHR